MKITFLNYLIDAGIVFQIHLKSAIFKQSSTPFVQFVTAIPQQVSKTLITTITTVLMNIEKRYRTSKHQHVKKTNK